MKNNRAKYFLTAASALGMVLLGSQAFAAHSGGAVPMLDVDGNPVAAGVPYSPKQTCASGSCHDYDSSWALATKTHGGATYQVPYPQHGVTAGWHFQQGRNMDWGGVQKHAYHLPEFTSSGGMYGKY